MRFVRINTIDSTRPSFAGRQNARGSKAPCQGFAARAAERRALRAPFALDAATPRDRLGHRMRTGTDARSRSLKKGNAVAFRADPCRTERTERDQAITCGVEKETCRSTDVLLHLEHVHDT